MTGSSSRLVFLPLPSDDPRQRRPDISQAREILGWEPKIDLKSGLEKTIAYFRNQMNAAPAADRVGVATAAADRPLTEVSA